MHAISPRTICPLQARDVRKRTLRRRIGAKLSAGLSAAASPTRKLKRERSAKGKTTTEGANPSAHFAARDVSVRCFLICRGANQGWEIKDFRAGFPAPEDCC